MKRLALISALSCLGFTSYCQDMNPNEGDTTWNIRCFPNPTSDLLVIESSQEIKEITLFDLNGQLIKVPAYSNWSYSLHDLPQGWLFVYIENTAGKLEKRTVYKY